MALDRMRGLRQEQALEERRKLTPDPVSGESMGVGDSDKTIQEIREDEHTQGLFLQFIHEKDKRPGVALKQSKMIVDKWLKGSPPPTPRQMEVLEGWRSEFNAVRAESIRVKEVLDGNYVRFIANMDPRIQQIVGQVGPDRAAQLIGKQLEDTAIADRPAFDRLLASMKAEYGVRNSDYAKQIERQGQERQAKYGISDTELDNAIRSSANMTYGVTPETQRQLEELTARNLGKFGNVMNFLSGHGIQKFRAWRIKQNLDEQRALLRECNVHFADAGRALHALLTPELYGAVQKAVLEGGDPKTTPETNVNTIEHLKAAKESHSKKSVQDRFKAHWKAEAKKLKKQSLADFTPGEQELVKDSFVDNEMRVEQKKLVGKGWLATILNVFFMSRAEIKKEIDTIWP